MNVLVTGGCGFIGKNLVKKLLLDKAISCIYVVDNFISSKRGFSFDDKRVTVLEMDICSDEYKKFEFIKLDLVYHLASLASPKVYSLFPLETLNVGFTGTLNTLELVKKHNSKMFYSSTSEIYGQPLVNPQPESYYGNVNTLGARSAYDESKRVSETLCDTFRKLYKLDIRIGRIFNTFGPGMRIDDGRLVPEIFKAIENDTLLVVNGTGEQTRSFCYIDTTLDMILEFMNTENSVPCINIGSDCEMSVNELIESVSSLFDVKIKVLHVVSDSDDPLVRRPCLILNHLLFGKAKSFAWKEALLKTKNGFV